jgi:carbonic anhydrase
MAGLLAPEKLQHIPNVRRWLENASPVREALANTGALGGPGALERAIEANIIVQLDHLRTHPCVAEALAAGRLTIHGWVYDIASGNIQVYDEAWRQFASL